MLVKCLVFIGLCKSKDFPIVILNLFLNVSTWTINSEQTLIIVVLGDEILVFGYKTIPGREWKSVSIETHSDSGATQWENVPRTCEAWTQCPGGSLGP